MNDLSIKQKVFAAAAAATAAAVLVHFNLTYHNNKRLERRVRDTDVVQRQTHRQQIRSVPSENHQINDLIWYVFNLLWLVLVRLIVSICALHTNSASSLLFIYPWWLNRCRTEWAVTHVINVCGVYYFHAAHTFYRQIIHHSTGINSSIFKCKFKSNKSIAAVWMSERMRERGREVEREIAENQLNTYPFNGSSAIHLSQVLTWIEMKWNENVLCDSEFEIRTCYRCAPFLTAFKIPICKRLFVVSCKLCRSWMHNKWFGMFISKNHIENSLKWVL